MTVFKNPLEKGKIPWKGIFEAHFPKNHATESAG